MGAWALGAFENDSALDWIYELSESNGSYAIEQAIESVTESDGYLEVDEGNAGLAAIEIINCLKGNPPEDVPEEVKLWLQDNADADISHMVPEAKKALIKIGNEEISEVTQLWLEQGHDWFGLLIDISKRLNA